MYTVKVLLGLSETFLFPRSALQVKIVFLLNSIRRLSLFAGTLTNMEPKLLLLIIFYSGTFLITIILIVLMCMYVYFLVTV
jgi:hypothetical protein